MVNKEIDIGELLNKEDNQQILKNNSDIKDLNLNEVNNVIIDKKKILNNNKKENVDTSSNNLIQKFFNYIKKPKIANVTNDKLNVLSNENEINSQSQINIKNKNSYKLDNLSKNNEINV